LLRVCHTHVTLLGCLLPRAVLPTAAYYAVGCVHAQFACVWILLPRTPVGYVLLPLPADFLGSPPAHLVTLRLWRGAYGRYATRAFTRSTPRSPPAVLPVAFHTTVAAVARFIALFCRRYRLFAPFLHFCTRLRTVSCTRHLGSLPPTAGCRWRLHLLTRCHWFFRSAYACDAATHLLTHYALLHCYYRFAVLLLPALVLGLRSPAYAVCCRTRYRSCRSGRVLWVNATIPYTHSPARVTYSIAPRFFTRLLHCYLPGYYQLLHTGLLLVRRAPPLQYRRTAYLPTYRMGSTRYACSGLHAHVPTTHRTRWYGTWITRRMLPSTCSRRWRASTYAPAFPYADAFAVIRCGYPAALPHLPHTCLSAHASSSSVTVLFLPAVTCPTHVAYRYRTFLGSRLCILRIRCYTTYLPRLRLQLRSRFTLPPHHPRFRRFAHCVAHHTPLAIFWFGSAYPTRVTSPSPPTLLPYYTLQFTRAAPTFPHLHHYWTFWTFYTWDYGYALPCYYTVGCSSYTGWFRRKVGFWFMLLRLCGSTLIRTCHHCLVPHGCILPGLRDTLHTRTTHHTFATPHTALPWFPFAHLPCATRQFSATPSLPCGLPHTAPYYGLTVILPLHAFTVLTLLLCWLHSPHLRHYYLPVALLHTLRPVVLYLPHLPFSVHAPAGLLQHTTRTAVLRCRLRDFRLDHHRRRRSPATGRFILPAGRSRFACHTVTYYTPAHTAFHASSLPVGCLPYLSALNAGLRSAPFSRGYRRCTLPARTPPRTTCCSLDGYTHAYAVLRLLLPRIRAPDLLQFPCCASTVLPACLLLVTCCIRTPHTPADIASTTFTAGSGCTHHLPAGPLLVRAVRRFTTPFTTTALQFLTYLDRSSGWVPYTPSLPVVCLTPPPATFPAGAPDSTCPTTRTTTAVAVLHARFSYLHRTLIFATASCTPHACLPADYHICAVGWILPTYYRALPTFTCVYSSA